MYTHECSLIDVTKLRVGISLYCVRCAMKAAAAFGWLTVEADVVDRLVGWVSEVAGVSYCW